MKPRFGRGLWLGLALIAIPSLALLALEIFIAVSSAPQLARNGERVVRTFDVITTAQSLQRSVQDAERGQRGFLLTGDEQYLAPYTKALDDTRPDLFAELE